MSAELPRAITGCSGKTRWQCLFCYTSHETLDGAKFCCVKPTDKARERQVGGDHYTRMAVQPWEAMAAWLTVEQRVGYHLGDALAYLARFNSDAPGKGGVMDVRKAVHHLQALIEAMEGE